MTVTAKIISTGVLYLLTIVTGIWLSHSGRPLNSLFITIHKLIALGSVVFTAIVIQNLLKNVDLKAVMLTLIIVAGLSIIALFITGALLSLGKPVNHALLTIHAAMPILAVIAIALTIYLLVSKK